MLGVDAHGGEALEIEVQHVGRRGLEQHLVLEELLEAVGILAVAAVLRPPRGLDVGGIPGLRPERAQCRRRMKRAGADFHVIGLQDDAAPLGPELLEREDQPLERPRGAHGIVARWGKRLRGFHGMSGGCEQRSASAHRFSSTATGD